VSKRRQLAWVVTFALALAIHLPAWIQYQADPFSDALVSDALAYDEWARRIATNGVGAEPVFHQSPLFPWLLSTVYPATPAGPVPGSAVALQILLSSLAISLLVPLGVVWFRSLVAGCCAAALALLHAPLVFHGLKLLPVSLALATQALALLALGVARERRSAVVAGLAGLTLGVAALARAEMLLFVPFAALALATRRRLAPAVALVAGVLIGIAPATIHNVRQGDFVLVASAGGENLFIGNQRGAKGDHAALDPRAGDIFSQRQLATEIAREAEGRDLRPSEVSAYWRGRAIDEVTADPLGWLRLEGKKLARILDPGDPTDMYSLALERSRYLGWLHLLAVPVWLVLGAGLVGIVLAMRGARGTTWPLAAFVAVQIAVLLLFFVSTRLRLPLVFALLPFAGLALERGRLAWNRGQRSLVSAIAAALLALTAWSLVASYRVPPREVVRLASVLSSQNRLDEALQVLDPVVSGSDPYALALDQAGWILQKKSDWATAAERYRAALDAGVPEGRRAQTHTRYGMVLERLGRLDEARAEHDAAVDSQDANAGAYYERGMFRARRGDQAGARADLERAARLAPGWPAPATALRRLPTSD
jgi:tetratricopeptide (TPR) repeat protein